MNDVKYSFTTIATYEAPLEQVWAALMDLHSWKQWWKGVQKLSVSPGEKSVTLTIGYWFYHLTFTLTQQEIVEGESMTFHSSGDLEGTGKFLFTQSDDATGLVFQWDIQTTKKWMNALSPILRPFFTFSHTIVMHWFVRGLGKYLHAKVLSEKYRTNR